MSDDKAKTMQWISEATSETFEREVIERSAGTLVLVDFWAEWCGPCRVLGPILEAAVADRGGQVWLVKVDSDRDQELALHFNIRSIPAVKAFAAGQLVGEFVGAQDRRGVDAFIDKVRPSEQEQALGRAEALLASGEPGAVPTLLESARQSPRHSERAVLLTARAQLATGDLDAAEQSLDSIERALEANQLERLRLRLELLRGAEASAEADAPPPDDRDAAWTSACRHYADGRHREALQALLELVQLDRSYRHDGARRAMLALFDDLGPTHELVREFRRQLQIYI